MRLSLSFAVGENEGKIVVALAGLYVGLSLAVKENEGTELFEGGF